MPRYQATAPIDILMELYLLHSLKSLSTNPGSGPFPSSLQASLVVLRMSLLMGTTVGGLVNLVSSGKVQSNTHILRPCTVGLKVRERMPRTRWVASRGGRLKPPNRRWCSKAQPTRSVSAKRIIQDRLSFSQTGGRISENLTFARWNAHSHIFKADVSLMPFLVLSDSVMMAGRIPFRARPVVPKKRKEEEVTPVRRARLNGSVARWMSC